MKNKKSLLTWKDWLANSSKDWLANSSSTWSVWIKEE